MRRQATFILTVVALPFALSLPLIRILNYIYPLNTIKTRDDDKEEYAHIPLLFEHTPYI